MSVLLHHIASTRQGQRPLPHSIRAITSSIHNIHIHTNHNHHQHCHPYPQLPAQTHAQAHERRFSTVYTSGQGWTGAMGHGPSFMLRSNPKSSQDTDHSFSKVHIPHLHSTNSTNSTNNPYKILSAKAGWGHTVLLLGTTPPHSNHPPQKKSQQLPNKLLVAGRPYDFHALLRLNRLPEWMRNWVIRRSLRYDSYTTESGAETTTTVWGRLMDELFLRSGGRGTQPQPNNEPTPTYKYGIYPNFTELSLSPSPTTGITPTIASPHPPPPTTTTPSSSKLQYDTNRKLDVSAGLTLLVSSTSRAYAFGQNPRGQCGIGHYPNESFVWEPRELPFPPELEEGWVEGDEDEDGVVGVAAGLQHGLYRTRKGRLFVWGKGTRGQLGLGVVPQNEDDDEDEEDGDVDSGTEGIEYDPVELHLPPPTTTSSSSSSRITHTSAGFYHSIAVTNHQQIYIWGKHTRIHPSSKTPLDSYKPKRIHGLPSNTKVMDVSCGSHHTMVLLDDGSVWGWGVPMDSNSLRSDGKVGVIGLGGGVGGGESGEGGAVCVCPVGVIEWPVWSFESHWDRTTVVFGGGGGDEDGEEEGEREEGTKCNKQKTKRTVVEMMLWGEQGLREDAVWEPYWFVVNEDGEKEEDGGDGGEGEEKLLEGDVVSVSRGWKHTVVVTE